MASFKQVIQDIKDYASLETAIIERLLENKDLSYTQREVYKIEIQTLKDITDIIKEGGK